MVDTVENMNGQLARLGVTPSQEAQERAYNARHGGVKGSYLAPWRQEALEPGSNTYGYQRQIPEAGDLYVAPNGPGMTLPSKEITPDHDGRQLPYPGAVPFDADRVPVESYRNPAQAFKFVPYWGVKSEFGPDDWPSRKLFPAQPTSQVVDSVEHDVMPLPFTQDNNRGYSVVDIDEDRRLDMYEAGVSGLGDDDDEADADEPNPDEVRVAEIVNKMIESGEVPDTDEAIVAASNAAAQALYRFEGDEGDWSLSGPRKIHKKKKGRARRIFRLIRRKRRKSKKIRPAPEVVAPEVVAPEVVSQEEAGVSGLGIIAPIGAYANVASQAIVDTAKANPTEAAKPGWLESALSAAVGMFGTYQQTKLVTAQAKAAAAGVPQFIPGTQTPIPAGVTLTPGGMYVPTPTDEPFYTKPIFLVLAAAGLLGAGYLVLKK